MLNDREMGSLENLISDLYEIECEAEMLFNNLDEHKKIEGSIYMTGAIKSIRGSIKILKSLRKVVVLSEALKKSCC